MNRHLKGFIASIVVIVLCAVVTVATFSQGVWYGVFPLALGIFFLIKFAIPSWKEYKEETTPKKENPLLHNISSDDTQRIKVNRRDPTTHFSRKVFLEKCESIIREYEICNSFGSQSCLSSVMTHIKSVLPKDFICDDLERQSRFLLMNRCADLLSTGNFHFYAASLTKEGEAMYRVYNGCSQWLLDNKYITQEEFDNCKKILVHFSSPSAIFASTLIVVS